MEYGIVTHNKFKFLSDDETEDPFESLAKAEQAKKEKPVLSKKDKKAAVVAQQAKPVVTAPQPKVEPEKQQQQQEKRQANKENESRENRSRGGGQRGGGVGGRGNRVNFAERKDVGNRADSGQDRDVMGDRFGETTRPPRGAGGGRGGPSGRGFRGPRRGFSGRGGGGDRQVQVDTHDGGFRSGGETEDENRPRGGGGGGGRGFRGPRRGFSSRGERHPGGDRHSGSDRTGVRPQPKREGHGKGNWGTENDELAGETDPVPVSDAEVPKPEERTEVEEGAKETTDEADPKTEEEKTKELTLEEWKAMQKKSEQPAFQTRRAGEGQDQKIYSKLVPLKKEEEPEEHEEIIVVRREPREKTLNIEVSFSDNNRPTRGGSGGERGYRGGRDRDDFRGGRGGDRRDFRGNRGGRGGRANFALNDEAFPALGGKA